MDALNRIVKVPAWAYDFCYYYLAVAAIVVVLTLHSLWKLFMLPNIVKRFVPTTTMGFSLILSGAVAVLLTMMQFWICRSALSPTVAAAAAPAVRMTKEGFASKCSSDADCQAINGPQGGLCTCGARGLCAGCTMRNNVEPSWSDEYAQPLAAHQPPGYWSMNQ
jgi:hypothetical protein